MRGGEVLDLEFSPVLRLNAVRYTVNCEEPT